MDEHLKVDRILQLYNFSRALYHKIDVDETADGIDA